MNKIDVLPQSVLDCPALITHMRESGFFTAPASTKWHGAYAGGLFAHCACTADQQRTLTDKYHIVWQRPDSPERIGYLHDLCKAEQYVFLSNGQIVSNKDEKAKGHGFYTVEILDGCGFELTFEERECIFWHMGRWTTEPYYDLAHVQAGESKYSSFKEALAGVYNLRWVCGADMIASHRLGT